MDAHELRSSQVWLAELVRAAMDGIIAIDAAQRIVLCNPAAEKMFGIAAESVLGQPLGVLVPERFRAAHAADLQEFARTGQMRSSMNQITEMRGLRADGQEFPLEVSLSRLDIEGQQYLTAILRDITARQYAEYTIRTYTAQQVLLARLSRQALDGAALHELMDATVRAVADVLDVEYCQILELLPDGTAFLLRSGYGWHAGLVGTATVGTGVDSQAGYTLIANGPVIVHDLRTERRFRGPPLLHEHHVVSGMSVPIPGQERPYGVLGVHSIRHRHFSPDDTHCLQAVAHILAAAIARKRLEEALQRSEQRFRALIEHSSDAIVILDARGVIQYACLVAERLSGYTAQELVGTAWDEYVPLEDRAQSQTYWQQVSAVSGHSVQYSHRFQCKDGSIRWLEVVATHALDDPAVQGIVVNFRDITERKAAADQVQASNARLAALSRQLLTVQEAERGHLARELHDEIGQILTAVLYNLQLVQGESPAAFSPRLAESIAVVDRAIEQVRDLSLDLRPAVLDDASLSAALAWYAARLHHQTGLAVHCSAQEAALGLPPEIKTACFRVAQAALSNVVRHAQTTQAWLELTLDNDALQLIIRDEGVGFDTTAVRQREASGQSFGLLSMRERVALAGGTFAVTSAPGQGTTVCVRFPVTALQGGSGDALAQPDEAERG